MCAGVARVPLKAQGAPPPPGGAQSPPGDPGVLGGTRPQGAHRAPEAYGGTQASPAHQSSGVAWRRLRAPCAGFARVRPSARAKPAYPRPATAWRRLPAYPIVHTYALNSIKCLIPRRVRSQRSCRLCCTSESHARPVFAILVHCLGIAGSLTRKMYTAERTIELVSP
jgi:hypothetical protein